MLQNNTTRKHRDDSNRRDILGRNSAYLQSCMPNLNHLQSIDLYSHDLESRYSPLHVTLRQGYLRKSFLLYKRWKEEIEFLSHKFGGHVLNQVDREGLNPLELYDSEFFKSKRRFPRFLRYRDGSPAASWSDDKSDISESLRISFMDLPRGESMQNHIGERGGSHILTLGSNVNYQLGTGTKDDRQNMFQLDINQLEKSKPSGMGLELTSSKFKKILITRYHSIILTTEGKIYTCGNSTRGRLGNGVADTPQPNYAAILDLNFTEVSMIATSNHHTLISTERSEVYSWGWNGYGQLGYSTNSKNSDDKTLDKIFSAVPKRIPFLDGEEIVGISCSKVHSCAITKNGKIFMWGLNVGQMSGPKPIHIAADLVYQGQDAHITSTPVVVNCSSAPIEQVVCTDFATFVRLQGNTLLVYTNYRVRSFKIPLPKAKTFKNVDAFAHFTPREIHSKVVDMKCNNPYGNNICFRYSCGRVGIITTADESVKLWTKFPNILPVTLYWIPNIENRNCLEFAVGSKGNLAVCTVGGEVFTCNGPSSTAEKMHSGRLITGRAIGVTCDSSFVSFAIIKDESLEVPLLYPKDNLLYDFSQYSPKYGVQGGEYGMTRGASLNNSRITLRNYVSNQKLSYSDENHDGVEKVVRGSFSVAPFLKENTIILNQADNYQDGAFDVTFADGVSGAEVCHCHKLFLKMRCPKLIKSIKDKGFFSSKDAITRLTLQNKFDSDTWRININGPNTDNKSNIDALVDVVHFFYTDEKPANQRASRLLLELLDNSYHLATLPYSLSEFLRKCWENDQDVGLGSPDVLVNVKEGNLRAHSLVLSSRSIFFRTMLKRQWCSTSKSGIKILNLEHITHASAENISCILKYMYGVPYNDVLNSIHREHFTEKIQFLLDLLELCDELNLDDFKNYLESVSASYINGETVIPILINAAFSNSLLLAENCCWFICLHVGVLFSKENLELVDNHFDGKLWQFLENVLEETRSKNLQQHDFSWYNIQDVDWIKLFHKNLDEFNERFVDSDKPFLPVVDLKLSATEYKSPNRRKSSTPSTNKSRKSSFMSHSLKSAIVEQSSAWKDVNAAGSNSAIDDNDEFIEVVKKSKRRTSSQTQPSESISDPPRAQPSGKVVIHTSNEGESNRLPSLLSQQRETYETETDTSVAKIKISFKKGSQRQRVQQPNEDLASQNNPTRASWGSNPSGLVSTARPKTNGNNSSAIPSRKASLPSLYDGDPAKTLVKTKKERRKTIWNAGPSASNEVISHGTWANASSYPRDEMANLTEKKLTLEERVAAQEFEKWFELESAKVQKELSKDNNNVRDEFKAVYNAAERLPDFIKGEGSNKKNSKKLKLKFQSKHRSKSEETDSILW